MRKNHENKKVKLKKSMRNKPVIMQLTKYWSDFL